MVFNIVKEEMKRRKNISTYGENMKQLYHLMSAMYIVTQVITA